MLSTGGRKAVAALAPATASISTVTTREEWHAATSGSISNRRRMLAVGRWGGGDGPPGEGQLPRANRAGPGEDRRRQPGPQRGRGGTPGGGVGGGGGGRRGGRPRRVGRSTARRADDHQGGVQRRWAAHHLGQPGVQGVRRRPRRHRGTAAQAGRRRHCWQD